MGTSGPQPQAPVGAEIWSSQLKSGEEEEGRRRTTLIKSRGPHLAGEEEYMYIYYIYICLSLLMCIYIYIHIYTYFKSVNLFSSFFVQFIQLVYVLLFLDFVVF